MRYHGHAIADEEQQIIKAHYAGEHAYRGDGIIRATAACYICVFGDVDHNRDTCSDCKTERADAMLEAHRVLTK